MRIKGHDIEGGNTPRRLGVKEVEEEDGEDRGIKRDKGDA